VYETCLDVVLEDIIEKLLIDLVSQLRRKVQQRRILRLL